MSKEQTPIEELVIRLADLYTALVRSKRPDQGMKLVSIITKEIEQFTQAKVLEALEDVIKLSHYVEYGGEAVDVVEVRDIETEVKPKYEV